MSDEQHAQGYREHDLPVSENLLLQDFYASDPNQKRAGDITYSPGNNANGGV
jgi:transposase InsO family protein